jgi:hypothetical protein
MATTAQIEFHQGDLPDGEEAGIASIDFSFAVFDDSNVVFHCGMNPDDSVIDASESDFPTFDCTMTRSQFHALIHKMLEFQADLNL